MLLKIALFAVVVFLVYIFFFKNNRKEEIQKSASTKVLEGETMVECQACSTFISHNEAIIKDGHFYCSKECARLP
ncbi:PP0621 family protein [Sulfurospirillum oryzae]|uniref:PP0621 family protein n=1 Tax=Sulfurospirillum oryzae TaxID=2976535 RepID=UPI0021E70150|nr:PP0621 family protein [Sulfurospirillum oryzae]